MHTDGGSPVRRRTQSTSVGTYHQQPACADVCTGELHVPRRYLQDLLLARGGWRTRLGVLLVPLRRRPAASRHRRPGRDRLPTHPAPTVDVLDPAAGGRTLVNFETNFFTRRKTLYRTVRLLGQRVDLRIDAHSYTWHFDDGKSITTSKPGAPYPRLQITHNYLQTGRYGPALDTTWVADYRVNGGSLAAGAGQRDDRRQPQQPPRDRGPADARRLRGLGLETVASATSSTTEVRRADPGSWVRPSSSPSGPGSGPCRPRGSRSRTKSLLLGGNPERLAGVDHARVEAVHVLDAGDHVAQVALDR